MWAIEINSKNKVKTLKKYILERIGLNRKADIILMKQVRNPDEQSKKDVKVEQFQGSKQCWAELTEKEEEEQCKIFADKQMAFKAFMEINVEVVGRGQSYKSRLLVDPKDALDYTLKKRTHFWKTFMSRSN